MAEAPVKTLHFADLPAPPEGDGDEKDKSCAKCGERRVALPPPFPAVLDDFDWLVRDYDSFRLFMMEELAHRFPDRQRWTAADMEVVIVELLASGLDRLSHSLDVIHGEHFLSTARRPESVRRLLTMIGYDALAATDPAAYAQLPGNTREEQLETYWAANPTAMNAARAEGPRRIGEQKRMVSLSDHDQRLKSHPLVENAKARLVWTSAWNSILVSLLLHDARQLDAPLHDPALPVAPDGGPNLLPPGLWSDIRTYHQEEGLPEPVVSDALTSRTLLRALTERYRMMGSEVFLENASFAPITFWVSVKAGDGYFKSELLDGLAGVFSSDAGGLFEPGNLGFGESVYASNIIEAAMQVEGIETACLNRFKRLGDDYADQTDAGEIRIAKDEIALCQNLPGQPELGTFELTILGGESG